MNSPRYVLVCSRCGEEWNVGFPNNLEIWKQRKLDGIGIFCCARRNTQVPFTIRRAKKTNNWKQIYGGA